MLAAYDACDMAKFASFFPEENVEFYHDKGGLSTQKKQIVEATQKMFVQGAGEMVEGSLEVYQVPGYGAIEAGSHRFFNRSGGKEEGGSVACPFGRKAKPAIES